LLALAKDSTQFAFFLETLETFENLLHAETQAIAAKHLDTIESIIERKDENLKALLQAKSLITIDPRSVEEADKLVDQVLELQERNVESFRRLFNRQFKIEEGGDGIEKPRDKKLLKAYLHQVEKGSSRLEG
jgi:flagellar biosynthesis/type III secretory pathway chaperone